jgi:hypothetical protein
MRNLNLTPVVELFGLAETLNDDVAGRLGAESDPEGHAGRVLDASFRVCRRIARALAAFGPSECARHLQHARDALARFASRLHPAAHEGVVSEPDAAAWRARARRLADGIDRTCLRISRHVRDRWSA